MREIILLTIERDPLWVVDVVHGQKTFGSADQAVSVTAAVHTGRKLRHASIRIMEGEAFVQVNAPVRQHGAGFRELKIVAEKHGAEVERIDAHIQQRASGKRRIYNAGHMSDGVVQAGFEQTWRSDGAGSDDLIDDSAGGHVARPDGLGDEKVLFPGQREHLAGLRGIGGEGFFAQDSLAVMETELHMFRVMGVRRGDIDEIDLRIPNHLLIGAIGNFEAFF